MSVRENKGTPPDDFEIPNCTVEDVDRALFSLFDKELPFAYNHKEGLRRAPVVFATGERFAVLRRKEPLRDRAGALVLPLVSIMRTGIEQVPTMGAGTSQSIDITIRKRLSSKDPLYQRMINKVNIKNSDDLASNTAKVSNATGSLPGRIATRRAGHHEAMPIREEELLTPDLGNNIFEVITMPPPKYYTAKYEVTFWAQYTTQMYVAEALTPGNNFDDFTDSERLVKYSFEITVPAYIIGSAYKGAPNRLRRYLSAPQIAFDADIFDDEYANTYASNVQSADPDCYVLDDIRTNEDYVPGQTIGESCGDTSNLPVALVGNKTSDSSTRIIELAQDPFSGRRVRKKVLVKTRIRRSGETVLRETIY